MKVFWWALAGGFFGTVATFAVMLLGYVMLFLGIYAIIIGAVIGVFFGAWKGLSERSTEGKRTGVKTSDRPFY